MKINAGVISATLGLTSDKIEITNPSWDTILLNLWFGLHERITDWRRAQLTNAALREEDIKQRLDWSIRQDLDDETDDLRDVLRACDNAKAQAEARLTSILQYLDPDEFASAVEEEAAKPAIDEDDAPEGYKAVPYPEDTLCRDCAFHDSRACPGWASVLCASHNRADRVEVMFIPRT